MHRIIRINFKQVAGIIVEVNLTEKSQYGHSGNRIRAISHFGISNSSKPFQKACRIIDFFTKRRQTVEVRDPIRHRLRREPLSTISSAPPGDERAPGWPRTFAFPLSITTRLYCVCSGTSKRESRVPTFGSTFSSTTLVLSFPSIRVSTTKGSYTPSTLR